MVLFKCNVIFLNQDQVEEHLEHTHGLDRDDVPLEEEIVVDHKATVQFDLFPNIETYSHNSGKYPESTPS